MQTSNPFILIFKKAIHSLALSSHYKTLSLYHHITKHSHSLVIPPACSPRYGVAAASVVFPRYHDIRHVPSSHHSLPPPHTPSVTRLLLCVQSRFPMPRNAHCRSRGRPPHCVLTSMVYEMIYIM